MKPNIDFSSANWDLVVIQADDLEIVKWFEQHDGLPYDYLALTSFILPWRLQRSNAWFCSEACAAALQIAGAGRLHPNALFKEVFKHSRLQARRVTSLTAW